MKTFVRLIRRYVLVSVGVIVLLFGLAIALMGWIGWREGCRLTQQTYTCGQIAASMTETTEGLALGTEHTPEEWMHGYAWAMVLDDNGNVKWNYRLPDELNRHYSIGEIAGFSRWYLDDYPVFCWSDDYGLLVTGLARGSLWRYNLYSSTNTLRDMVHGSSIALIGILLFLLLLYLWLGWRGTKRLETVAKGLDALAEGQTVELPTNGFTGELAQKLNQTSAHLQKKNEMLTRRDDTRTQWIAGVSHDVRTPLALILGWSEQLELDRTLPDAVRQKSAGIRRQCEKLRTLVDDLNLTSKLEYGAQPLRREVFPAGALIRELVAQFCDTPPAENCELSLDQTDAVEHAELSADRALLDRLFGNLLNNSVQHNVGTVKITIHTEIRDHFLCLDISDNGKGYPPEVLSALNLAATNEHTPHILGLHVVEQIVRAHGGSVIFEQAMTGGARTDIRLPLATDHVS